MKRIPAIVMMASLALYGQRIETQKADRTKITRLATTLNHLSVIEFNEPVREVAVGSSNFKVEWRQNKVFVQPLEADAATNLFIWTASGRQSYELIPAGSVNEMHFAIDEDPGESQTKQSSVAPPEQPKVPAAMLMESTPVKMIGSTRSRQKVAVIVDDVYQKDGRVYIRYTIENGGNRTYLPVTPAVFALQSPRAPQSLIALRNCQLSGEMQLRWKDEAAVPVLHGEMQTPVVKPGESAHGIVAFETPQRATAGQRTVVSLRFPQDGANSVNALLVL
jgi:hypothetical protein